MEVGGQEMSEAPITQEKMVSDLLCKLHTHKSVSPPQNNGGTAKELAKPLSVICQQSWYPGFI